MNIQNSGSLQENDLDIGNEYQFDLSMGVDLHEIHSQETDMNIGQSPLQQLRSLGPPYPISSRLVFQLTLEEPSTDLQDSREDDFEGEDTNDIVIFEPDIEPDSPVAAHKYQIKNPLLCTVEEARKLDQMRRIDDLGNSTLDSHLQPMLI